MDIRDQAKRHVVGGVDTHKDLHVAAVVDERDRVLGSQSFATTRQGYRQMLAWMGSFGEVQRIGIESTGSYGAGLLRFVQTVGNRGSGGHDAGPTRSPSTWKERRSRRAECGPCRLCRPADRYAPKARRPGRIAQGLVSVPKNSCSSQARGPAVDPEYDRLRARWIARRFAQHDPHAAHSHSRRLATGPDCLSRRGSCLSDHLQVARSPLSRIARRNRRPRS